MINVMELRRICAKLAFEATEGFYIASLHILENIYNGCGPDWLPAFVREKLTDYLDFFQPAFLEHDYSFEYSDKTHDGFNAANKRLYNNCKKLIAVRYSWWREPVSKARRYYQAYAIYKACDKWGWSAWCD